MYKNNVSRLLTNRMYYLVYFQMCTPANTPATPPNFPDALTMLSKMSMSEKMGGTSPAMMQYATSPPSQQGSTQQQTTHMAVEPQR